MEEGYQAVETLSIILKWTSFI